MLFLFGCSCCKKSILLFLRRKHAIVLIIIMTVLLGRNPHHFEVEDVAGVWNPAFHDAVCKFHVILDEMTYI